MDEIHAQEILVTSMCDIFFVKDRIDKKELKVEYCPTHLMLADYFSKPLRGKLFREQREYLMGWRPLSDLIQQISNHAVEKDFV